MTSREADDGGESARPRSTRRRRRRAVLLAAAVIALFLVVGGSVALWSGSKGGKSRASGYHPLGPSLPEVEQLKDALRSGNAARLFAVVSDELQEPSRAAFSRFVARGIARTGRVEAVRMAGPANSRRTTDGGLGSMTMQVRYARAPERAYRAYFLFERGAWRLLTTLQKPA